jgi:hypothetical protein
MTAITIRPVGSAAPARTGKTRRALLAAPAPRQIGATAIGTTIRPVGLAVRERIGKTRPVLLAGQALRRTCVGAIATTTRPVESVDPARIGKIHAAPPAGRALLWIGARGASAFSTKSKPAKGVENAQNQ